MTAILAAWAFFVGMLTQKHHDQSKWGYHEGERICPAVVVDVQPCYIYHKHVAHRIEVDTRH